jgi:hypothetical protein
MAIDAFGLHVQVVVAGLMEICLPGLVMAIPPSCNLVLLQPCFLPGSACAINGSPVLSRHAAGLLLLLPGQ